MTTSNVGAVSDSPQTSNPAQTAQSDTTWTVPTNADGTTDWSAPTTPDPSVGFHFSKEEKDAADQRAAKFIEDMRKMEEAKAEQARIKAGAPIAAHDAAFEHRTPRDVLRQLSPPRYAVWDVPAAIGDFASRYSEATGFDVGGAIVAAVTAAASMIDDRYRLMVRPESNWWVSARQWSVLCGGPSTGKSPCVKVATDHVKAMHRVLIERWQAENSKVPLNERPPAPAIFTSDATLAALSSKLEHNERGLLMLTEEFASWIGAIDAADRGEAAKNRGDWLQLRDGGPHQIDRIGRGSIFVPNWGVSVLAACTPDGLAKQMKQMPEDGLIQRFIPCIMAPPNLNATGDAREAIATWSKSLEWIYQASTTSYPGLIQFDADAQLMFDDEVRHIRELVVATEAIAPAYAAHLGKHPGMLAEIALTFHFFTRNDHKSFTEPVGLTAIGLAIRYLRKARRHAYTLYSSILSSAPAFELARAVARSIVAADEPIKEVSRDWMTQHCQAFKKADDRFRREAVQILEDADWLSAQTHVRSYGGWPSKYWVHPMVFTMFAREGEQWRARRAAVRDAIGEAD